MLDDAERRTSAGKKTHHGLLSGIWVYCWAIYQIAPRQRVKREGSEVKWRIYWKTWAGWHECGDRSLSSSHLLHPMLHSIVRIKTASLEFNKVRAGAAVTWLKASPAPRLRPPVPNSYYQYLNFKPHELIAKINLSLQRIFIQVLGRV